MTALRILAFLLTVAFAAGPDTGPRDSHVIGLLNQEIGATAASAFRGNAARTGEQPGPSPTGSPVLRWRSTTGDDVLSSVAVTESAVFTLLVATITISMLFELRMA